MFKKAFIQIPPNKYILFILIIAPLLNFLTGTDIDLFSPSLPAMASHFQVSDTVIKNAVTFGILGFASSCLFTGLLMDLLGRRKVIASGLFLFCLVSLAIPFCHTANELMVARFFQGMFVAAASIGSRTLIIDHCSDKQYMVGILYISIAYSLGVIVSPLIGGILQSYLGWKACFYTYAGLSLFLLIVFVLLVNESSSQRKQFSLSSIFNAYASCFKNKKLILGAMIIGLVILEQVLYPTLGPFIVQGHLGYSPVIYGFTALGLGISYLIGNLLNRLAINTINIAKLELFGVIGTGVSGVILLLAIVLGYYNIYTLVIPLLIMNFSLGFVYPNTSVMSLEVSAEQASIASALFIFSMLLVSSISLAIINSLSLRSALDLAAIILVASILQLLVRRFVRRS